MKLEDFVDSIRKEFRGRAPKVQKLCAIHSIARTSVGINVAAKSISVELAFLAQRIQLNAEQIEKIERILSLLNSIY